MKKILSIAIAIIMCVAVLASCAGKSAYDLAVENGFEGTEQEWLDSLKGAAGAKGPQGDKGDKGDKGDTGAAGADGEDGAAGTPGKDGTSGSKIEIIDGYWYIDGVKTEYAVIGGGNTEEEEDTSVVQIGDGADFIAKIEANLEGNFVLTQDITLTETVDADVFKGTLDGAGHTITISKPIFTTVKAEIKNLKIAGAITITEAGSNFVAPLAQFTTGGTYTNIENSANVTNVGTAAGFIAKTTAGATTFENCTNKGTIISGIQADGSIEGGRAGGFMDVTDGDAATVTFINCKNEGAITSGGRTGGFIGDANKGAGVTITNCSNSGAITGEGNTAGAVGQMTYSITVNGFTNTAKIMSVEKSAMAAGVVGYRGGGDHMYTNCHNTGELVSTRSAGGILGGGAVPAENFVGCSSTTQFTINTVVDTGKAGTMNGHSGLNLCGSAEHTCTTCTTPAASN